MPVDRGELAPLLRAGALPELFNQLGWDNFRTTLPIELDGVTYLLEGIAQKRGFQVFRCKPDATGAVPPRAVRTRLYTQLRKVAHEHVIIFTAAGDPPAEQVWQYVDTAPRKPRVVRDHVYRVTQSGEPLLQKLDQIHFDISEEETLTLAGDVLPRVHEGLGRRDRVTRRFFERFQTEHRAFLGFIRGIEAQGDREWYASVMLNRLMFVYFVQKKHFLDGDPDYLRTKLREVRANAGAGAFHSFYRRFLLRLFHQGLAQKAPRGHELDSLLGQIPYLNGGIFDVHRLEAANAAIEIPDEAFEKIFDFFDAYEWHLDDRPLGNDNEINPDVLGHIFEKYINQKQMGAYYTKEDITGYISRNTIIPFLLDRAKTLNAQAFEREGALWRLLREDPDRYIYEAVRRGVVDADGNITVLPAEIAEGIEDVSKRDGWNRPAADGFALPTETWREHVARRQRCLELREKLSAGEVHEVNDLITLNLDIEQFAADAIAGTDSTDFLRAMYRAIAGRPGEKSNEQYEPGISVLDPTCGSGAFLFAALNILAPLYDACLDRMEAFIDDLEVVEPGSTKLPDFRKTLERVADHPNRPYFILKSIIIGNLYGVDIMEEAVEICKLRLFLKLMAQVEPHAGVANMGVEALPDIDFNIRAGNTLVGFTSLDAVRQAMRAAGNQAKMAFAEDEEALRRVEERAVEADAVYRQFRLQQTALGGQVTPEDKERLSERLAGLAGELDQYLARQYGVDPIDQAAFDAWRASHEPFHWYAEFYGVMHSGGFDVIVGNPPYVAAKEVRKHYRLLGYKTADTTDIYANVVEKCTILTRLDGRFSMIVPLSVTFSRDFSSLRVLLADSFRDLWFSSYARIPAALFSADVRVRNTIFMGLRGGTATYGWTTRTHRWFQEARPSLFSQMRYCRFEVGTAGGLIPKFGSQRLADAFLRLGLQGGNVQESLSTDKTTHRLGFKQTAYNWLTVSPDDPPSFDLSGAPIPQSKVGDLYFRDAEALAAAFVALNGKLAFIHWLAIGDDFDVTAWMLSTFPVPLRDVRRAADGRLQQWSDALASAMQSNVQFKLNAGKRVGTFNLAKCRITTDAFDRQLLAVLGLSQLWEDLELCYIESVKTQLGGPDGETGEH